MKQGTGLYTLEEQTEQAVQLHKDGKYPNEIASIMNVTQRSVYRYLRRGGIDVKGMHPRRHKKISISELKRMMHLLKQYDGDRKKVANILGLASANAVKYREDKYKKIIGESAQQSP